MTTRTLLTRLALAALLLVCGVLNSRAGAALWRFMTMETGRPLAQIDLASLKRFPLPAGSDEPFDDASPCGRIVAAARALHDDPQGGPWQDLEAAVAHAYGWDPRDMAALQARLAKVAKWTRRGESDRVSGS